MEVISLSEKKKKVLKSQICFFLSQKYNSVSGQAGVRASHHSSTSALTLKHLKMKFPLTKEQQSDFGSTRSKGIAHTAVNGGAHPYFLVLHLL